MRIARITEEKHQKEVLYCCNNILIAAILICYDAKISNSKNFLFHTFCTAKTPIKQKLFYVVYLCAKNINLIVYAKYDKPKNNSF